MDVLHRRLSVARALLSDPRLIGDRKAAVSQAQSASVAATLRPLVRTMTPEQRAAFVNQITSTGWMSESDETSLVNIITPYLNQGGVLPTRQNF